MTIKKITKPNIEITKSALKDAYQIVKDDLFTAFTQMKADQTIRLTNIGTFEKKWKKRFSGLTGKTHQYYQITFRMSRVLKEALD